MKEWIEKALDGTGWSYDDVMAGVDKGDFFLFSNERAVLVCEFITSPRHKVMHCWAAGGEIGNSLTDILYLAMEAEAYGVLAGCDSAGATGRSGWVRALEKLGYKRSETAVEKEL